MIYHGTKEHVVPDAFSKYTVKLSEKIEDHNENIEIIPETMVHISFKRNNTQKAIWWMSVDNYYRINNCSIYDSYKWNKKFGIQLLLKKLYRYIKGYNSFKNTIRLKDLKLLKCYHFYQSEYARIYLLNNGFSEIFPLEDYINTDFSNNKQNCLKKNIVLYNPAKGYKFTNKLISLSNSSEITWMPLKGLSRAELVQILQQAKVYIDFGNHPGKDRLPRECALNGCVIITGKRGAAFYYKDIMISDEFKFDESNIEIILKKIKNILDDYETYYEKQHNYRSHILIEKNEFEQEIQNLFNIK